MSTAASGYISLDRGRLHYLKFGRGRRILLAFHGYGNNANLFQVFERHLAEEFTILSFDLPHHGRSDWEEGVLLHKKDLTDLVKQVCATFGVQKVALAGYSMGGRVCLTIAELLPESVDKVLLIASDGLVFNPLYFFVTKTMIGKRIFRSFLTDSRRYMKLVEWLRKKEWIDPSRYRFAMYYLESESDRSFLLRVWPSMSLIIPNMKRLKAAINKYHLPVFIFMGAYDRIIPVPHAKRFSKDLRSVQLFVLDKGHRVFDSDSLPQMARCLITGTC